MLDIEPIKARLAAATPGPWQTIVTVETDIGTEHLVTEADMDASCIGTSPQAADADLIAHAPTDLAALIAEVERLRVALQAQVDDAVDEGDTRYWAQLVLNGEWPPVAGV